MSDPSHDLGIDALDRRCSVHGALAERLSLTVGGWARRARTGGLDGPIAATLAAHSAQFAWHARLWFDRAPTIDELPERLQPAELDDVLDAVDAPVPLPTAVDGLYGVVLPGLADLHAAALARLDARLDGPTARVLTLCLRDLRAGIDDVVARDAPPVPDPAAATAHRTRLTEVLARSRTVLT